MSIGFISPKNLQKFGGTFTCLPLCFFFLINLFLPELGLRCCTRALLQLRRAGGYSSLRCVGFSLRWFLLLQSMGSRCVGFSSCGSWALERRLSSCGTRAQLLRGMWDLPGPGFRPGSPALAGGFLTTAPPGKSLPLCLYFHLPPVCLRFFLFPEVSLYHSKLPSFIKIIYLFIWLHQGLSCSMRDLLVAGSFSCGMWTLSCGMRDLVP